ncbi:MAG TPA: SRPBCC family protein [Dehalococcoidia bacterium]
MVARNTAATDTADREILITRLLNAPRELAFRAWTDPEQVVKWWGPRGFKTTTHETDIRPGGVWRFIMHGPDGTDFDNKITYIELVEPERIVYDHGDGEDGEQFRTTVTFEAQGEKTLLSMRVVFPTREERDRVVREHGAVEGGNQTVDRLEQYLSTVTGGGRVLEINRMFDAPRERVFAAWTEPERFAEWWGPRGFTTPFCEIDLQPGGLMRFCMRSPEGQDIWCGGVFRDVTPPSRLLYTVYFTDVNGEQVAPTEYGASADWPVEALVTVQLNDYGGKTNLTLLHHAAGGTDAEFEGANEGWNQSFDKLAEYLAR